MAQEVEVAGPRTFKIILYWKLFFASKQNRHLQSVRPLEVFSRVHPSAMEVWVGGDGIVVLSGGWRLRGWANASSAIDRSAVAKTSWIPAASWLYYD